MRLRVCYFPQVPCKPFIIKVKGVKESVKIMDILARLIRSNVIAISRPIMLTASV
jgi:hypothetical protein